MAKWFQVKYNPGRPYRPRRGAYSQGNQRSGTMFFSNWESIGHIVLSTVLVYVAVVVLLRLSGKRTLAKMNAFDLIVTIALGSCVASVAITKTVKLLDGLAGIITLVALQYIIAWLSVRFQPVQRLIKSEPRLLFHHGEYLADALRRERVTEEEVRMAARTQGHRSMQDVAAVVLETDGTFSVMGKPDGNQAASAMQDVLGADKLPHSV